MLGDLMATPLGTLRNRDQHDLVGNGHQIIILSWTSMKIKVLTEILPKILPVIHKILPYFQWLKHTHLKKIR